jgi:hypothetical protein
MDLEKEIYEEIKNDEMNLEIKYNKPYNPILEEYSRKYKPEELTDDGVPNIETQLREIKEKDEEYQKTLKEKEEKIYKREMVQRVKCLCLLKMDRTILTNTNELNIKDKNKLQNLMWEYNDIDHKDIINEFNEKISHILDSNNDTLSYPIYEFK